MELYGCHARRVPRPTSAGSAPTSGARTASTSPTDDDRATSPRRAPASRTARPRTSGSAPGVAPVRDYARRRRPRRPRRRRLRLERARRPPHRGEAGAARRARARRPERDDRARRAPARNARRRRGARTRRHRLARAGQARRLRGLANRRARARRRRRPGRRARPVGAASRRPPRRRGRGRRPGRRARPRGRGRRSRAPTGRRREDSRHERHRSPRTSSTPAPGKPARGVRVELCRGERVVVAGETDADGRVAELAARPRARPLRARRSGRRRRSSRASSSRSSSATATTTSRSSSRPTGARATAAAERRRAERALRGPHATRRACSREIEDPLGAARTSVVAALSGGGEGRGARGASRDRSADGLSSARPPSRATTTIRAVLVDLAALNAAYEDAFGFRFVVFVEPARRRRMSWRCSASGSALARRGARHGPAASSSRSRGTGGPCYLRDVLDVILRMLHVIAGIAWIGASFYFVRLDLALRPPKQTEDAEAGVAGEFWGVHGGGLYHSQKYQARSRRDARAPALVQVGGVHDVALRASRCSSSSTTSTRDTRLVDPAVGRSDHVAGGRAQRRRASRSRGSSTTSSAATVGQRSQVALAVVGTLVRSSRVAARASSSRRGPRTCRSA